MGIPKMQDINSVALELLDFLKANTESVSKEKSITIKTSELGSSSNNELDEDAELLLEKNMEFSSMKTLLPVILPSIFTAKYDRPSKVQACAIPIITSGNSVAVQAVAGTGKTIAFVVPAINKILESRILSCDFKNMSYNGNNNKKVMDGNGNGNNMSNPKSVFSHSLFTKSLKKPIILVISPTKELNTQTSQIFETIGDPFDIKTYVTTSSINTLPETIRNIDNKNIPCIESEVLVGSPGSIINCMRNGLFEMSDIEMIIIDEADMTLIRLGAPTGRILRKANNQCQLVFFSASYDEQTKKAINFYINYIHKNTPKNIKLGSGNYEYNKKDFIVEENNTNNFIRGTNFNKQENNYRNDENYEQNRNNFNKTENNYINDENYEQNRSNFNKTQNINIDDENYKQNRSNFNKTENININDKNYEQNKSNFNENENNYIIDENYEQNRSNFNESNYENIKNLLLKISEKIRIKKENVSKLSQIYSENALSSKLNLYHINTNQKTAKKTDILYDLLDLLSIAQLIIFCNTKKTVDYLTDELEKDMHKVSKLHGDIEDIQREKALSKFKNAETKVLVTTDVFSRGMDIPQVNLIINFDMPKDSSKYLNKGNTQGLKSDHMEIYQHRIGRTGRFGRHGFVIDFVDGPGDYNFLSEVQENFKTVSKMFTIESLKDAMYAKNE